MNKEKELQIIALWNKARIFHVEVDRLKEKIALFTSPVLANQVGFQNAGIYPYLYADIFSRYFRMNDYNVLYPTSFNNLANSSFTEIKKKKNALDKSLVIQYQNELENLGIGYDRAKSYDHNSENYVLFLQQTFLALYHKGLIKYEERTLYTDKKKYYQEFEVVKKDGEIYSKNQELLHPADFNVFILNIDNIVSKTVEYISKLNLQEEVENEALSFFNPYDVLDIAFYTTLKNKINIIMKEPQYIGGISYIMLNPNLMEYASYVSTEEKENVEYGLLEDNMVFSGSYAINPLTGRNIPIFIGTRYEEKIHFGIPDISLEDYEFVLQRELDYIEICEEGYILNSDFITGMTISEAKEELISSFVKEGIATITQNYAMKEIVISSMDQFGCLIPFIVDDMQLFPLDNHLPVTFSSKFRSVIPNSNQIDAIGSLVGGTLNKYFTAGLAPIANVLHDVNTGISELFSEDSLKELKDFHHYKYWMINSRMVISDLVMPILFYQLIEEETNVSISLEIEQVLVMHIPLDPAGKDFQPSNLNLLNYSKIEGKYLADAIRMYYLSVDFKDVLYFDESDIEYYQNQIYGIRRVFSGDFLSNAYDLEMQLFELDKEIKQEFISANFKRCYEIIILFQKKYLQNPKWTLKQAFIFLKWVSVFFPFLAEEVYENVFNVNHSILEEDFR